MGCNRVMTRFLSLLLPLCLFGVAWADSTPSSEDLKKMLAESVAAQRIQTAFPEERKRRDEGQGDAYGGGSGSAPAISQSTANVMLLTALGVFALVLFLTLRDNLRPLPASRKKESKAVAARNSEEVRERMNTVRLESEELAARGDFAGAMHVLLLQSLEEMRRRLRVPMAVSLTSREILGKTRLEDDARVALADIVDRVEISYFGTHAPGADEYAACRHSFAILARLLGGGGPA